MGAVVRPGYDGGAVGGAGYGAYMIQDRPTDYPVGATGRGVPPFIAAGFDAEADGGAGVVGSFG